MNPLSALLITIGIFAGLIGIGTGLAFLYVFIEKKYGKSVSQIVYGVVILLWLFILCFYLVVNYPTLHGSLQ